MKKNLKRNNFFLLKIYCFHKINEILKFFCFKIYLYMVVLSLVFKTLKKRRRDDGYNELRK